MNRFVILCSQLIVQKRGIVLSIQEWNKITIKWDKDELAGCSTDFVTTGLIYRLIFVKKLLVCTF